MHIYNWTAIFLLPALLLSLYASGLVKARLQKYSGIANAAGLTGMEAARLVLDRNGLSSVGIGQRSGSFTDAYDPRSNTVYLSNAVMGQRSIAAMAVACHECGHALQDAEGNWVMSMRNAMVPLVSFSSRISWLLVVAGVVLLSYNPGAEMGTVGETLLLAGAICFFVITLFHLLTVPMELNASKRALVQMETLGLIRSQEEETAAKKVLRAAALTYVAALAVSIANLLRVLALLDRRR